MNCPLCNQTKHYLFAEDKKRTYLQCKVCKLVFVPPKYHLSRDEEKQRYDKHHNDLQDEGYRSFLSQLATPLSSMLKPGSLGLDFGCGPGKAFSNIMLENDFYMERYDPFYANNVELLKHKYNFITATEVMEHLYHPAKVFEMLSNMLHVGGFLGVMTKPFPAKKLFNSWWYKNDPTHVCFYSKDVFLYIAETYDFTIHIMKGDVVILKKKV